MKLNYGWNLVSFFDNSLNKIKENINKLEIRDTNKNYQLKYELSTCKWMLYKI